MDALFPSIDATVPLLNFPGVKSQPANLALFAVIKTDALSWLPDTVPVPLKTANP